ncbi:hypothetical protein [Streptomyces chilikensis]|uniref:Uncharacterized protein n=1 Tax=Streptomyces chilikensis TaxID=1194079 RepID=A0ABV3EJA2_9ACTN
MPRIECPSCGREVGTGPVAGAPGLYCLARHDRPGRTATIDGLLSCVGSLATVPRPEAVEEAQLSLF